MNSFFIQFEAFLRLVFFLGIFCGMVLWERFSPRRSLTQNRTTRWLNNIGLVAFNTLLVRLLFPAAAVGAAVYAEAKGWGLLRQAALPEWVAGITAIAVLDLVIYLQHVLFHKVPFFWRFHRMHHTDLDIDVTSGTRFHPVEILISMGIKIGTVVLLGAPVWSVIAFEILLNGTAMFNHSNILIAFEKDRVLRRIVVTPDMHRVHHSVIIKETDSNYGFNFPWWDRFFGTYRAQPEKGHTGMTIGLANYRDPKWLRFHWMLVVPFFSQIR